MSDLISVVTREDCTVGCHVFRAGIEIGVNASDASRLYRQGRLAKSAELDALIKSEDDAAKAKRILEDKRIESDTSETVANILAAEARKEAAQDALIVKVAARRQSIETGAPVVEDRAIGPEAPKPAKRSVRNATP